MSAAREPEGTRSMAALGEEVLPLAPVAEATVPEPELEAEPVPPEENGVMEAPGLVFVRLLEMGVFMSYGATSQT